MQRLKYLLITFNILLIAALVIYKANDPSEAIAKPFLNFSMEQVAFFEINHFANHQFFKLEEGVWKASESTQDLLNNKKDDLKNPQNFVDVSGIEVARALTLLFEQKFKTPVATYDLKKASVFEINPYSLHVTFYDNIKNELGTVFIGKQGPDLMSCFIKNKKSSDVYLASENFNMIFLRELSDWQKND